VRKRTTTYNEKRDYHSTLQKFVRGCQYGVIHSLERFFLWYGELVASHPVKAIIGCFIVTALGGAGLLRFYEEGDAASLVIPVNSQFRKNIDWLDDNFPREIRVHSVIYTADNVLTPEVMKAIYKQRVAMDRINQKNLDGTTKNFQDYCIRVPILKFPEGGFSACSRNSSISGRVEEPRTEHPRWQAFEEWGDWPEDDEWNSDLETPVTGIESVIADFFGSDVDIDTLEQWSNDYYPDLYCGCIEATETACFEQNIIELWGDQVGIFFLNRRTVFGLTF
jgi:hypothetical protein